jgi:2-amino-4-hydroxy-6-hydroxymethyldihydropteridine diphosphokinase
VDPGGPKLGGAGTEVQTIEAGGEPFPLDRPAGYSNDGVALNEIPVLLAMGANIGDPVAQLRQAVEQVGEYLTHQAVSSLYVTEPVGIEDQPEFYNLVLSGRTRVNVYDLHAGIRGVEDRIGRERSLVNGPRRIDIDLLAYGELLLVSSALTLPHPRLHERSFVLVPLDEIAPEWRHPLLGHTAAESLRLLATPTGVRRHGPPFTV